MEITIKINAKNRESVDVALTQIYEYHSMGYPEAKPTEPRDKMDMGTASKDGKIFCEWQFQIEEEM